MATCPRCHGHLSDHHRCPRRPIWVAAEFTLAAILGALVAIIFVGLIDPEGNLTHLHAAAVAAGIFGGIGLDRLLRG
jgi:uncharacterized membrane-anchored protein YitT (DUF2179 family)